MDRTTSNQNNPYDQSDLTQRLKTMTQSKTKKSSGAFKTISEVAAELDVQQHVLRFWETKFSQIKPLKRGGGRRYYRPEDLELLKKIHYLLYTQGYTIKGVQKLFKEQGKSRILEQDNDMPMAPVSAPAADHAPVEMKSTSTVSESQRRALHDVLGELKELRRIVRGED